LHGEEDDLMGRIVYVNGEFVPEEEARVSVFDRAFLFADGVYEVSSVIDGKLVDNAAHLRRLQRSLEELRMPRPASDEAIVRIQKEIVARNGVTEGTVYLQVTRGAADRDFAFPKQATPGLVVFSQARSVVDTPAARTGIKVITVPDLRWKRRDIKTVGLLAASLAKQQALEAGADDAWMVEDGYVTEGSSNNAYIVNADGVVVTRHLGSEILHGITRAAVLRLSQEHGVAVQERPFTVDEALAAREAFVTSASAFVLPVVSIDGQLLADGRPGPVARRLRALYIERARETAQ
jgi:D-alanine transaminase